MSQFTNWLAGKLDSYVFVRQPPITLHQLFFAQRTVSKVQCHVNRCLTQYTLPLYVQNEVVNVSYCETKMTNEAENAPHRKSSN